MSEQVNSSASGSRAGSGENVGERRRNERLRTVFDTAFLMVEPFFDPAQGWGGHSLEHLAFRVVRENFPEFTSEEVHSLVVAAHRVYIERNPANSDHLPRPGGTSSTETLTCGGNGY